MTPTLPTTCKRQVTMDHGTPNGYVNRGCRCDPCRWAWASYRRGDDPVFPAPVWFDVWLAAAGAL